MDDSESFSELLEELKGLSNKRDPRSVRLASVTSALVDVVEGEVTPTKVFASACTALEGTLHQDHQDAQTAVDSLATQVALLELFRLTLSHVAPETMAATLPTTTRVLRGIVASCQSIAESESNDMVLETKDGLDGLSSVLRSASKAGAELLRYMPPQVDPKAVRRLLQETLLGLFHDPRSSVKKCAHDEIFGLLNMASPSCHDAIPKMTSKYVVAQLQNFKPNSITDKKSGEVLNILGFLQASILSLDFSSLGGLLMAILLGLFTECTSLSSSQPDFLAKSKDLTPNILLINGVLSTILVMFESETSDSKKKDLDHFAARVLASLLQLQPILIFRDGVAEPDLLESGRTIFGQVMLSAAQRLLTSTEVETGCKMLPLVIQQVLQLCRTLNDEAENIAVADTLLVELAQLFRVQLYDLKSLNSELHGRCCQQSLPAIQMVLQEKFSHTWHVSLKALIIVLQQLDYQDDAAIKCVQSILKLRQTVSEEGHPTDAFDDAVSALVQAIGLEQFWHQTVGSNSFSDKDISSNIGTQNQLSWLFRTMKAGASFATQRMNLSFFQETILSTARKYDQMSVDVPSKAIFFKNLVMDLWALFPCFCRHPLDLSTSFPKVAPLLVRAMGDERYPQLVSTICTGLSLLADGVFRRSKELEELIEAEEGEEMRKDSELMANMSERLLPSLFKLVDSLHASNEVPATDPNEADPVHEDAPEASKSPKGAEQSSNVEAATKAIASLAQLAPKGLVQSLFSKVMQRLLEASQAEEDLTEKMCSLLSLSQALVSSESLELPSITLLYRSLKPLIRTDETKPKVHKRAYKVLGEICNRYPSFITEEKQLKELLEFLTSTSVTSQVSARHMRIKCLKNVVEAHKEGSSINESDVSTLLGEALLCLKDSNARTRATAYDLILSLVKAQGNPTVVIQAVTAAIASQTTHMRSAAVMALSRLVYEFAREDISVSELLPSLLKTVLILSDDPSREVTKSMIAFVRVSVVALSPGQLEPLLPEILNGLLKYHRGKDRFRAKIKIILKKLVKLFGYDLLIPLVPPTDTRLLTHMRKISEREARRKLARREQGTTQENHFDDMMASDEEDSDDGRTLFTAATRMSKITNKSGKSKRARSDDLTRGTKSRAGTRMSRADTDFKIKNDSHGEVFDIAELTKKAVRFETQNDGSDSDGDIGVDASGKLIITEDQHDNVSMDMEKLPITGGNYKRSTDDSTRKSQQSQKKRNGGNGKKIGSAYKAKKAGGDVKKQGQKYDPYAYVPLDGRSYTKKNRHQAVEQMGGVVNRGRKRQKR